VLSTPEQVEAFKQDWEVHGLTLREMAAMHGFRNINSVTRAAKRLGLKPRPGGREPRALVGGHWEKRGLVMVWVEDGAA
jgi:hypothetical protein